ncbi:ABC transporter permease [Kineosporia mesophila]|uniref:ABC transporter permease n=1 Tax=Kineosporia mesophila TaxID=566012 RepID=UPI001E3148DA|nr:ABC transporter permease [Kineosporia mesophila]
MRKRRPVLVGAAYAWLALVIALAVLAPWLPIAGYSVPAGASRLSPGPGSVDLLLGTDSFGRSLLSRCIHGARVSLLVGTGAGLAGLAAGTVLGLLGGYLRGRVDRLISLITDALLAFPPLILLIALSAVLTPSIEVILIGLTLVTVPNFVRLSRAQAISWSSREFVRAARNMGAGSARIMTREVLPNLLPALGSFLPVVVAALIVAEGSLSFLGLGVPPPRPSWGGMINEGKSALATSPHLVLVPATVIFLTVFSLNQVGDHLRLRFDRTL